MVVKDSTKAIAMVDQDRLGVVKLTVRSLSLRRYNDVAIKYHLYVSLVNTGFCASSNAHAQIEARLAQSDR